jgi:taurine--2-oxoglutarate transaminase
MRDEKIVERAAAVGRDVLGPGLAELKEKHPCVGEVRGIGVFWAVELVSDRATKEPLAPYGGTSPAMNEVIAACKKGGMLPFANYNRIHVVPPCNISDADARDGLAVLDAALSVGDAHASG